MVERLPVKEMVVGSNPTTGAVNIFYRTELDRLTFTKQCDLSPFFVHAVNILLYQPTYPRL